MGEIIRFYVKVILVCVVLYFFILAFIFYKPTLLFKDRSSWHVHMGYKSLAIDLKKSIQHAHSALLIDGDNPLAHKLKADQYFGVYRFEAAKFHADYLNESMPCHYNYLLGEYYLLSQSNYEESLKHFSYCKDCRDYTINCNLGLAESHYGLKNFSKAYSYCKKAKESENNYWEPIFGKKKSKINDFRFSKCRKLFKSS